MNQFELDRCPHCGVHRPQLSQNWTGADVRDHSGGNPRDWVLYKCTTCGGFVIAWAHRGGTGDAVEWFPHARALNNDIPPEVARFLRQAIDSLHAPDGAIMLAASAVDAMLKLRGLTEGSLYRRIDDAKDSSLITPDMAEWAHDIRLDANDPRHADQKAAPPTLDDAQRVVTFAETLAEILFVLPARVRRGRQPEDAAGE